MTGSLHVPSLGPITINGTDYTSQLKSFWCTDVDLTLGIGQFNITLADKDGSIANAFPPWPAELGCWKPVSITANGNTLFTGLIETVTPQVGVAGNEVVFEGYNKGSELLNMFISKDYSQIQPALRADLFLKDVLFNAGRTLHFITPSSPIVQGPTPGIYPAIGQTPGNITQQYMSDIVREVLSAIGYAGNIDITGNLNMFSPVNPQQNGLVINNATIQSVFPTDPQSYTNQYEDSNVKEGNSQRSLHETKNYLEYNGAGTGYDPTWNGLTTNAAYWGTPVGENNASWAMDAVNVPSVLGGAPSIVGTVAPANQGQTVFATYNFNFQTYGVKNDVDQVNCLLNLPFNRKTGMHLWVNANFPQDFTGGPLATQLVFTDTNSNTATLNNAITLTSSDSWYEATLPVPFYNYQAWTPGQSDPYYYSGAFNFSAIQQMSLLFVPNAAINQTISKVGLNDIYFVCQPFYVPYANPNLASTKTPNVADVTYGERDQAVNAGGAYVNQLDLQAYGDASYASYTAPMLRGMLTVVVDPQVMHFQAGKSVQLEIPRWKYTAPSLHGAGGTSQYWRLLQVRWEGSNKGLIEKLDVMSSSAI